MTSNARRRDIPFLAGFTSPCMGVESQAPPVRNIVLAELRPGSVGQSSTARRRQREECDGAVTGWVRYPPRSVYVHPGFDSLAIIAWRSPFDGVVSVAGFFSDLDPNCDNGVLWSIDKGGATLGSGDLPNGGAPMPFRFRVRVKTDEVLYFIVDPKEGDYACDTTGFDVMVRRADR